MELFGQVLLVTTIAGVGGTGLGGVVAALFRRDSSRVVSLLLSFAAGVMLSVVCFNLITDALDSGDLWFVAASVLIGYGTILLLNHLIDRNTNPDVPHINEEHPKVHDDLDELIHFDHWKVHQQRKSQLFLAGVVMACAIALHNLPEGMIIGASYARDLQGSVLTGSGMVMAMVIGLHDIPEGMAVAVPLMAGGMPKGRAMLITALSGAPTVLGAIIGYFLGSLGDMMLAFSLSFASGAMLYVVFGELLPASILMWKSKAPAFAVLVGMLVGLFIIFG